MAAISSVLANDRGRVDISTIGNVGYHFGASYLATVVPGNDRGIAAMSTINGTPGNDVLEGTALQDDIYAGAGDDQVDGKEGYDLIYGGPGNDTLYGGSAFDPSRGSGGDDTIYGDEGDDFVAGGQGTDTLYGGDGNDRLFGDDEFVNLSGNDTLYGGAGDDLLNGGWGSNTLYGGDGNDILYSWGYDYNPNVQNDSANIKDTLYGGAGDDTYWVIGARGFQDVMREDPNGGYDTAMILNDEGMFGAENIERFYLFVTPGFAENHPNGVIFYDNSLSNVVYGTPGDDSFNVAYGGTTELVYGGAGNDYFRGDPAVDWLYGGEGNDRIEGNRNDDHLFGEAGNDSLEGGEGKDELAGGAGDDLIFDKAGGGDLLYGEDGNDLIQVSGTNTGAFIYGDAGDDQLWGGDGNDTVVGGTGNDILYGGAGNDGLVGGAGNDQMRGEAGEDHFYFGDRATGNDIIYDFSAEVGRGPAHDILVFDPSIFANYAAVMAASAQVGGDVVITISEGNTITLWGGILEALTPDDFYFG